MPAGRAGPPSYSGGESTRPSPECLIFLAAKMGNGLAARLHVSGDVDQLADAGENPPVARCPAWRPAAAPQPRHVRHARQSSKVALGRGYPGAFIRPTGRLSAGRLGEAEPVLRRRCGCR